MGDMTFEQALTRLEEIVARLEEGNLPLEQTIELFSEGMELSRLCEEKLREAEGRVEKLVGSELAGWETRPFEE
ncbi:MAG: exodeoxyribonuclease VII small subunit [Syntrophomonadaceae bacterium]|jgi:exodeoxyribonuclease VII small subunit|nr:exodeoxyribonuclease VII small subunit [Syntrophomonadaceae bacterium]